MLHATHSPTLAPNETGSRELTLNVIYTRGTVRSLSLFIWSMLDHADCRFRLVANGCTSEEMAFLRRLAAHSPRLSFLALPTKLVMLHGQALNYLQARTDGDRFGFLDSDIIAAERLPATLLAPLAECTMRCCFPASVIIGPDLDPMTALVEPLCCTYLAVYDNHALTAFIRSTGIGFDKYLWSEIPGQYQQQLTGLGLERARYDTAQLLTLLLANPDQRPWIVPADGLVHIGGFSQITGKTDPSRMTAIKRAVHRLPGARLQDAMMSVIEMFRPRRQHGGTEPEWEARRRYHGQKKVVSRYFGALFDALIAGDRLPDPPRTTDSRLDGRVRRATCAIVASFEKHGVRHTTGIHPDFYQRRPSLDGSC